MAKWVSDSKFLEETGYTKRAVECKIQNGIWLEGDIYIKAPDGRYRYNIEAHDKWVESGKQVQAA